MSEYLLQKFRPAADALLSAHGLSVDESARDMLAKTIMQNRAPTSLDQPKRSPRVDLQKARTHAAKLLEYVKNPPARQASVALRRNKLADALRSDYPLLAIRLIFAKPAFDPMRLLQMLDDCKVDPKELRHLLRTLNTIHRKHELKDEGIGRPWAPQTFIVRAGCIAWERAGRKISYQWHEDSRTLKGSLGKFLRELVAYCDGTHSYIKEIENLSDKKGGPLHSRRQRVNNSRPTPKGNALRRRTSDSVLHDGLRAWRRWCKVATKNGAFLS